MVVPEVPVISVTLPRPKVSVTRPPVTVVERAPVTTVVLPAPKVSVTRPSTTVVEVPCTVSVLFCFTFISKPPTEASISIAFPAFEPSDFRIREAFLPPATSIVRSAASAAAVRVKLDAAVALIPTITAFASISRALVLPIVILLLSPPTPILIAPLLASLPRDMEPLEESIVTFSVLFISKSVPDISCKIVSVSRMILPVAFISINPIIPKSKLAVSFPTGVVEISMDPTDEIAIVIPEAISNWV